MDQRSEAETFKRLSTLLRELADETSTRSRIRTSFLERHTIALFANPNRPEVAPHHRVFDDEIAHPNKVDKGMHLVMHPADAKAVLESRWGTTSP
jgi:hypothetical protein